MTNVEAIALHLHKVKLALALALGSYNPPNVFLGSQYWAVTDLHQTKYRKPSTRGPSTKQKHHHIRPRPCRWFRTGRGSRWA